MNNTNGRYTGHHHIRPHIDANSRGMNVQPAPQPRRNRAHFVIGLIIIIVTVAACSGLAALVIHGLFMPAAPATSYRTTPHPTALGWS